MKVLILSPSDMNCEPVIAGIKGLSAVSVGVIHYDRVGIPPDRGVLDATDAIRPNLIAYIGQNGGPYLLSTNTFLRLKKLAPTVFLLFDGTDVTWEPLIAEYRAREVFDVTVNIDGNRNWTHGPRDLTLLTPTAPSFYQ